MRGHPKLCALVMVSSLVALTTVGCATAASMRVGSGDVVADRQRLMKLNGASWADAQAKFKAGNIEGIAVNAETMALNSMHIPALFPEGSLTDKSKAKPEVWQKWAEFEAAAKNFQTWAEKLRDTARTKDAAATEAIVKDFGRQACGTCHTPFRVPPPRS
ncbi:MAG: cytochrome c [candidate division NC10 bacterium]|nr:cytochrome c [candidate division NC10 bacterium]